jgi:hypothetical protein
VKKAADTPHLHSIERCLKMIRYAAIPALLSAFLMPGQALAQVSVEDVQLQLFLEKSGKLSENLVGTKKKFVNTPAGEGDAGEPADSLIVTLTFAGPKNTTSSDKIARDVASITVTQMTKAGPKVLRKAYAGFRFGENGKAFKTFSMDGATCLPLEVEVKVGKTRKAAKIDFECAA